MNTYKDLKKIPISELIKRLTESNFVITTVLENLKMSPRRHKNRKYLKQICIDNNLSTNVKTYAHNKSYVLRIKEAVKSSLTLSELCRKLDLSPGSGNHDTLKRIIIRENINISHFDTIKARLRSKVYSIENINSILVENSKIVQTTLRRFILNNNLLEYKCFNCEITKYNDKPITLTLDHKNGINTDHRLENLRFMCPNCDSQQDTYGGKNIKRKKQHMSRSIV